MKKKTRYLPRIDPDGAVLATKWAFFFGHYRVLDALLRVVAGRTFDRASGAIVDERLHLNHVLERSLHRDEEDDE